jgi:leader peptidase (prepilin peptidase) / N-methyltransferase
VAARHIPLIAGSEMTLAFPVTAAVLAAGLAWPASVLVVAYTASSAARLRPHWLVPILTVVMAALALAAAVRVHPLLVACAACWLAALAVPLALTDALVRRLPDPLTAAAFGGTVVFLVAAAAAGSAWPSLVRAGAGAAVVAGLFLALTLARPGSAGLGDAKLGLSVGALTGWLGWEVLLSALFVAFTLTACYGLVLLALRKGTLRTTVPFGPFLVAGCIGATLLASFSI